MHHGGPPVTPYNVPVYWTAPAFWNVLKHFYFTRGLSALDVKILLYSAGRAMLWLVVISSIWSMYGYFRAFYVQVRDKIDGRNRRRLRTQKEEEVAYPVEPSR
jgi:hypothetical protein